MMAKTVTIDAAKGAYISDLTFADLLSEFWARRFVLIAVLVVGTLVGTGFSLLFPNAYRSSALLAPSQMRSEGLSSMLGQYGGLAALAGMDLGISGDSESRTALGLEVLRSRRFLMDFLIEHEFAPELFCSPFVGRIV